MLSIRLPADIEHRLAALAKRTGRTKASHAREAIEKHLDDLEDLHLADAELANVRAGRSKTAALVEVIEAHRLDPRR